MPSHTALLNFCGQLPQSQLGRYHGGGQCYSHELDAPATAPTPRGGIVDGVTRRVGQAAPDHHAALMRNAHFQDARRRLQAEGTPTAGLENAAVDVSRTPKKRTRCTVKLAGLLGDTLRATILTKDGYCLKSQNFPIATALGEQTFTVDFTEPYRAGHLHLDILTGSEKTGHVQRTLA